jgi:hypothetical protein
MGKFTERMKAKAGARKQAARGKISVRLVEFAQPLIDDVIAEQGPELTEEQLRNALMIAVTIWNAQVMEQIGKGSRYINEARRLLSSVPGPADGAAFIQGLIDRKIELFRDDLRYIGNVEVYRSPAGELRVMAEARLDAALWDEH